MMGHSSIQVTFDIYGHLFPSPDDDAKAMAQIEARLLGSWPVSTWLSGTRS